MFLARLLGLIVASWFLVGVCAGAAYTGFHLVVKAVTGTAT
jgi:hypothetical protein